MFQVKELYVKFNDDDGHSYLINQDIAKGFEQAVDDLYGALFQEDEDLYYEEYENLLDMFGAIRLEGEDVFAVLPKDVIDLGD